LQLTFRLTPLTSAAKTLENYFSKRSNSEMEPYLCKISSLQWSDTTKINLLELFYKKTKQYISEYRWLSTVYKRGLDGDNSYLKFRFNFWKRKLYIFDRDARRSGPTNYFVGFSIQGLLKNLLEMQWIGSDKIRKDKKG
jgi:hypothetical protein